MQWLFYLDFIHTSKISLILIYAEILNMFLHTILKKHRKVSWQRQIFVEWARDNYVYISLNKVDTSYMGHHLTAICHLSLFSKAR